MGIMNRLAPVLLVLALALAGATLLAGEEGADGSKRAVFPDEWHSMNTSGAIAARERIVGKKTPPLHVKDWMNGKPGRGDFFGKIVVIDFWGTWCKPCIAAIPHTNEIMHEYEDKGVRVMGVCDSNRGEMMGQVVREHGLEYPTALDVNGRTVRGWSVMYFPYYVLVDRKGVVRAAGLRPDKLGDALDALLEEQPFVEESDPAGERSGS